jgi:hypothetical protein
MKQQASMIQFVLKISGAAAVVVGVLAIAFGSFWASRTLQFFSSSSIGRAFETSVPFFPILLITLGAILLVRSRQ